MLAETLSRSPNSLYEDYTRPIEERVDDLIARMTLEEKISQMAYDAPAIERLGIPAYNWWNECLHGVARAGVATVFPQAIGLAATWDIALMGQVATAISDEARAKHHEFVRRGVRQIYTGLTMWSPNVNIFRDPRWGRGQETYGEDPYLTARMGVTFVKGLQGDDPRYLKVVATPKHFAVHSGPELSRHEFDARVSERDLRETYLPAFEACVKEGAAASIMGAYNRLNGEPCCASPTLLQKILREEWGFEGYVVSDCWAINDIFGGHGVVESPAEASALAVKAGCDLECGCAYPSLLEAVEQGLIDEPTINQTVTRLFAARFRLGMFDPPEQTPFARLPYEINDSAVHRSLARRAAQEAIVLLKNDGLLPLAKELKSIAVIGPGADDLAVLLGNYCGTASHAVTPLEGIRRKVLPETAVYTALGCEIAAGVPPLCAVPAACLRPPADSVGHALQGLAGAYYPGCMIPDDRSNTNPAFVRVDPLVDFGWRDTSPLGGQVTDHFCVRWRGALIPPTSGKYLLGVRGSSGYLLRLDGCELLPYESNDHHVFTRTVPVELEGGRLYDVCLDYVNAGRTPEVQLLWAVPGQDYIAEALRVAENVEVVVMVMGLSPALEGEEMPVSVEGFVGGDRTDIALPRPQQALLEAINGLGKPVVLVLMGGSALAVNWAAAHVSAILAAWYPGEEGGSAIADVLFGDVNPAGRLPVTFYKSLDQLPPFDDYSMAGRTYRYLAEPPLYPFGHGLSYTSFGYSDFALARTEVVAGETSDISVRITNTGGAAGDEVVQLYVQDVYASIPRPVRELKGYVRVALAPGESRNVTFHMPIDQLAFYDADLNLVVESGSFKVMVGASSADIRCEGVFEVTGAKKAAVGRRVFVCPVTVA
jgi:beta-glucosidase